MYPSIFCGRRGVGRALTKRRPGLSTATRRKFPAKLEPCRWTGVRLDEHILLAENSGINCKTMYREASPVCHHTHSIRPSAVSLTASTGHCGTTCGELASSSKTRLASAPPSPNYVRMPQNIPLFCSTVRSNPTEYCNVDALVLLGGRIKVIVEIEESALGQTKVFGKFLTSAAAHCYIHDADEAMPAVKGERVLFIQVMDTSHLKPRSTKREQWRNIEFCIRPMLPLGNISEYHLIHGDEKDFTPGQPVATQLAACLNAALFDVETTDGGGQP